MSKDQQEVRPIQVRESFFQLHQQENNVWSVRVPHGIEFDRILDPKFWASIARLCKPFDEIVVKAEDGSYYGRLLVMNVMPFAMQVGKLEYYELDKLETISEKESASLKEDAYKVEFDGTNKWKVISSQGKEIISKGHTSKKEAEDALRDYLKRMSNAA